MGGGSGRNRVKEGAMVVQVDILASKYVGRFVDDRAVDAVKGGTADGSCRLRIYM